MQRKHIAIILSCLIFSTLTFADTKVKARQTMQGQSFENTTYIKGKRQRSEQNLGGQNRGGMETVTITQCDLRRSVRLMPANKVYVIDPYDTPGENTPDAKTEAATKPQPKVTQKGGVITSTTTIKDTGERKQMFGYTARHLIITMETESSPEACTQQKSKMQTDGWYIDATFGSGCDDQRYTNYRPASAKPECRDRYEMKQVGAGKRGYPVWEKMTMFDESGKESYSMLTEVVELSSATLDASLFEIPAGYREVKDANELYTAAALTSAATNQSSNNGHASANVSGNVSGNSNLLSSMGSSAKAKAQTATNQPAAPEAGAKKTGVVRFGLSNVKVGAVGEGLSATELATAIQNSLTQYLKAPNVEVVPLEAALPSAIEAEARQKECDYVIYSNITHKKGSGGFGKMLGKMSEVVSRQAIGSSNIGGQIARTTIVSAATASENVKAKDEISLDIKLRKSADNSSALVKQFNSKAKSDGEDILTPLIEQTAQAIFDAGAKR